MERAHHEESIHPEECYEDGDGQSADDAREHGSCRIEMLPEDLMLPDRFDPCHRDRRAYEEAERQRNRTEHYRLHLVQRRNSLLILPNFNTFV